MRTPAAASGALPRELVFKSGHYRKMKNPASETEAGPGARRPAEGCCPHPRRGHRSSSAGTVGLGVGRRRVGLAGRALADRAVRAGRRPVAAEEPEPVVPLIAAEEDALHRSFARLEDAAEEPIAEAALDAADELAVRVYDLAEE